MNLIFNYNKNSNMYRIEDVTFTTQWKNFTISKSNLFVPMFGHKCESSFNFIQ